MPRSGSDPLRQVVIEHAVVGRVGACEGHQLGQLGTLPPLNGGRALLSGAAGVAQQRQKILAHKPFFSNLIGGLSDSTIRCMMTELRHSARRHALSVLACSIEAGTSHDRHKCFSFLGLLKARVSEQPDQLPGHTILCCRKAIKHLHGEKCSAHHRIMWLPPIGDMHLAAWSQHTIDIGYGSSFMFACEVMEHEAGKDAVKRVIRVWQRKGHTPCVNVTFARATSAFTRACARIAGSPSLPRRCRGGVA